MCSVLLEGDTDPPRRPNSLPVLCILAIVIPVTLFTSGGDSRSGVVGGVGQAYATESLHGGRRLLAVDAPSKSSSFDVFLPVSVGNW